MVRWLDSFRGAKRSSIREDEKSRKEEEKTGKAPIRLPDFFFFQSSTIPLLILSYEITLPYYYLTIIDDTFVLSLIALITTNLIFSSRFCYFSYKEVNKRSIWSLITPKIVIFNYRNFTTEMI